MAGEWRFATVAKLQRDGILRVEDGNHGEYRPRKDEFVSSGVAFIRAADMDGGVVLFDSAAKINDVARQRITKGIGAPGDILLSHKGTVGKLGIVPEEAPAFVCSPQTTFWRTLDTNSLDRKYLYAFLRSPEFKAQLATRAGETDMAPYVSLTSQRGFSVTLPPLAEQRAIAHILGTLDDKIELNRRRNQTLEAMARALFKDWFVDFGPVRAKMEGREPYLPTDLWQLFPDQLDDEGKPEGWKKKRVSDFLGLAYGKSLPAGKRHLGDIPVYGSGGITGFHNEALVNGPVVIVGRKGTVGSLYWEDRPCFPIDTVFFVQPEAPLPFCYCLLESLPLRDMNTDAAVPGLNRENVYRLDVAAPPAKLISPFAETAWRFRESIAAISKDSETLAQLRDILLPKLISGELRIKDTEKFVESVA